MTWDETVAWADALVYSGYDDWRLPTMIDTGLPGCESGTDCGYYVQTTDGSTVYSEMASLFYDTLGNDGFFDAFGGTETGCHWVAPPYCLSNTGPFINLQPGGPDPYWFGREYVISGFAWSFDFRRGEQNVDGKSSRLFAWAVRPGDVVATVPEPGTLGLLGAGLGLLGIMGRRKRRRRLALQ